MSKGLFKSGLKLGIIKGGQLGRMMIQSAIPYDVECFVMDSDHDAPCKSICYEFTKGDALSFDDVYRFGKKVDVLTFEFEHVCVDALLKLQEEGVMINPSPSVLKLVQDKGDQKEFYRKNQIPTSEFLLIESQEIKTKQNFLPAVQKLRRSGYDGRGVQILDSLRDFGKILPGSSILEKKVDLQKEISILLARSVSGDIKIYPAVELVFHPTANLVTHLFSPAAISESLEKKAVEIAKKIAELLNIVGVLAVEMFVTKSGELLVNEIAPRPHNSGHHTIEANQTSQFEQHFRAVCGMPLGATNMISPSVMVNLLGEPGFDGNARYEGMDEVLEMENVHVHLYGKKKTKPFRKMGHVTVLDADIKKARKKADKVLETLKVLA